MPVLLQLFQSLGGGVANLIKQISTESGSSKSYVGLFETSGPDGNNQHLLNQFQIGPRDARSRIVVGWLKRYRDLKAAKRNLGITVTISHSPWLHALNIFTGGADRKVLVLHGTVTRRRSTLFELYLFRTFFFLFDKATDVYITVSEELQLETLRWVKNSDKVRCIINAVDPEEIVLKSNEPLSATLAEFLHRKSYLVSVGRLHQQKNFSFLIRLFARLKNSREFANHKLVIVGDGNQLRLLTRIAKKKRLIVAVYEDSAQPLNPAADVLFTRHLANPFPVVKLAQAYLSTSLYEGYPFAVCEAMVLSKKLILSDCPTGHAEILSGSFNENYALGENNYGTLLPMQLFSPEKALLQWEKFMLANAATISRDSDLTRNTNPDIYQNKVRQLSKWKEVINYLRSMP